MCGWPGDRTWDDNSPIFVEPKNGPRRGRIVAARFVLTEFFADENAPFLKHAEKVSGHLLGYGPTRDFAEPYDLIIEACKRYGEEKRTYAMAHFLADVAMDRPSSAVKYRLFGRYNFGVLTSIYFESLEATLKAGEVSIDSDDEEAIGYESEELEEPELEEAMVRSINGSVREKVRRLIAQLAQAGAFKPFHDKASEIFELWCRDQHTGEEIAALTGVGLNHVYQMNDVSENGYIMKQMRRFGSKCPLLQELKRVTTPELVRYFSRPSVPSRSPRR